MTDTIPLLSSLRAARDGRGHWAAYPDAADAALEEYFTVSRSADVNIIAAEAVMRRNMPAREHERLADWADTDRHHWRQAVWRHQRRGTAPAYAAVQASTGYVGSTQIPLLTPHEADLLGGGQDPIWWLLHRGGSISGEPLPESADDATVRHMAEAAGWHVLDWTAGDLAQGPVRLSLHELLADGNTYADEPEHEATCYGLRHAADALLGWLPSTGDWDGCPQVRATLEDGSDATEQVMRIYARRLGYSDARGIYCHDDLRDTIRHIPDCWSADAADAYITALEGE